jgi:superfamily II DNA or RNA helicase
MSEKSLDVLVQQVKTTLSELLNTPEPLYDIQEKALRKLLEETTTKNRLVFQLPTGAGKTRVVAAYLWGLYHVEKIAPGDKVIFLTPRVTIKKQVASKEFGQILNKPPFEVVELVGDGLTGKLRDELGSPRRTISIIVTTPHLLNQFHDKYGIGDLDMLRAVLLDEGHFMYWGPETSRTILDLTGGNRVILAFTATPTEELISGLDCPPVYYYYSRRAMSRGILTPMVKVRPYDMFVDLGQDEFNNVFIKERARKIAAEVVKVLQEESGALGYSLQERIPKTLVAAANVREAEETYRRLNELLPDKPKVIMLAHYKTDYSSSDEVERFKESDEGILVTVNMADMGFDDRNLEVLVIARRIRTPVAYVQIRGRVLRRHDTDDVRNLKVGGEMSGGHAVLVDLVGLATKNEEEQTIEDVERGMYSSEGAFSDLAGGPSSGAITEVEASVDIKEREVFTVPRDRTESSSLDATTEKQKGNQHPRPSLKELERDLRLLLPRLKALGLFPPDPINPRIFLLSNLRETERAIRKCEESMNEGEEMIGDVRRDQESVRALRASYRAQLGQAPSDSEKELLERFLSSLMSHEEQLKFLEESLQGAIEEIRKASTALVEHREGLLTLASGKEGGET